MRIVAKLAGGLKAWVTCRPKLDIDESVTWFLFSFVYALGLSNGEFGLKFSSILPQLSMPQVSLVMVFLCLVVSITIFVEPLLPSKMSAWTDNSRQSGWYQILRRSSMWFAFIFAWVAGLQMLSDTVPELSWLIAVIAYVGFGIFLVLGVRIVLALRLGEKPCQPE